LNSTNEKFQGGLNNADVLGGWVGNNSSNGTSMPKNGTAATANAAKSSDPFAGFGECFLIFSMERI
jgi:hypothetical protein